MTEECFLHYETVQDDAVSTLSTLDSWKTIFNAARIPNDTAVVEPQHQYLPEDKFPKIKFHKSCRAKFTIKHNVKKLDDGTYIYIYIYIYI